MPTLKKIIHEACEQSGRIIRANINKKKSVKYKSDIDLLTATDKKVEETIIKLIKKNFPEHDILAEESGTAGQRSAFKWIIDPIDGTTNFYHTFPQVSTSIAVERDGIVIAGAVYDPMRDELFYAEKGKGARMNGKKIRVSETKKLGGSLLVTGFPYDRRKKADYYLGFFKAFMMKTHGIRRLGSAAMDYCYVACGRFDGYWEFKLKPWDVAAGSLILKEAGGKLSDFEGNKFSIYESETLATNAKIHAEMVKVTRGLINKK
jgi:myo-inositol-1(or 4)-monophosphatase